MVTDKEYKKSWLSKDMQNMGYIFEYCNKYCENIYGVSIDREKFIKSFMKSAIRKEAEAGNPSLLAQSAIDTVQKFIDEDCEKNIEQFKGKKSKQYSMNQLYWAGMIYAYLHYAENKSSSELEKIIPLEKMLDYYYLGHEMDVETFHDHIKPVLNKI